MKNEAWPDSVKFWQDKRVMAAGGAAASMTGGNGFLGKHVINALHQHGVREGWIVDRDKSVLRQALSNSNMASHRNSVETIDFTTILS